MSYTGETATLPILRKLSIETILPLVGFAVPLFISGPQIITGSLVNMLLVLYAVRTRRKHSVIMCAMPSIGAIGNGLLFGTFTPFLFYFLPFIWIANLLFVRVIATWKRYGFPICILAASALKSAVLFLVAALFVGLHIVPRIFISGMGIVQLVTAVTGGFMAMWLLRMYGNEHA